MMATQRPDGRGFDPRSQGWLLTARQRMDDEGEADFYGYLGQYDGHPHGSPDPAAFIAQSMRAASCGSSSHSRLLPATVRILPTPQDGPESSAPGPKCAPEPPFSLASLVTGRQLTGG